ncbi:MAG TPA: trypsin-like peptidase domain-containing protein [Limnochordia bacterium]
MSRLRRSIPYAIIAAISFLIGGMVLSVTTGRDPLAAQSGGGSGSATTAALISSLGDPYAIADIAERATPAVVFITVTYPRQARDQLPFDDPFFRQFFGPWFGPFTPPQGGQAVARGTGFIIDQDGHILTNQHVVGNRGDGQEIKVKLTTPGFSGEVPATLLGSDYRLDLAVLRIEKPRGVNRLPVLPLGNSDESRPGEWVIAIGNPYGEQFEHTVTVGVLSATGREITIYDEESRRPRVYTNLMQTDAAINPGNSGGPLLNIRGQVIGINTAVNTAGQGIGFAIPINVALRVKEDLIEHGSVQRAWVGIQYGALTEQTARALGLSDTRGVVIVQVLNDSPAAKAGLEVYDVITRVGETPIQTMGDLPKALAEAKPGDQVLFVVVRRGQRMVIPVTLGTEPSTQ